ncbi:MAG TPA: hypothetical protein VF593_04355 [Chthoniobacteraceae bacterium]
MTQSAAPVAADVPHSQPSPPRRAGAWLLDTVSFLAAFILTCAAIGSVAPFPEVPGIYPKWAHFQQRLDQFDTLFIGSSRFYHQIIPAQFDAAIAAAAGEPTSSFNFAYDGMWPPESYYLIRKILASKPPRLKWLVIDLMDINVQLDARNKSTLRMTYWHDAQHTWMAFRDILTSRWSRSKQADLLWQHGRLWFTRATHLGWGSEALAGCLNPRPPRKKPYSWAENAGFEVGPDRRMEGAERERFESEVAVLRKGLKPIALRPIFREALTDLIAEIRQAGVEPIFVIAPTINPRENFVDLPAGAPLIALNDPAKHPELFATDHHYDAWHLNAAGAVHFTRMLAERFVEHTRPRR